MKRALIIEKMPCHQEIIPSWVWALTRLGYAVDIVAKAPPHRHIGQAMTRFRRNYRCLPPLFDRFAGSRNFEIALIGDGGQNVLAWLALQIQPVHRTRMKAVLNADYERFFEEVRTAGWVMPCVDETFEHGYF